MPHNLIPASDLQFHNAKGKKLSSEEQALISAFPSEKWSLSRIERKIGRRRNVICNFLKDPKGYNATKRAGRKSRLSAQAKRALWRAASSTSKSAGELRTDLQLPVEKRRTQQVLNECDNLVYCRRKKGPKLLERHKKARLRFAGEHHADGEK